MEEVANAFNDLAATVDSRRPVSVGQFADACSKFSGVFNFLEASLKFAKKDLVDKVGDLAMASRSISTLEEMVNRDIAAGRVYTVNSHTSNLLKIKRGLQLIKVFCEEILVTTGDSSLKAAARKAYYQVLYNCHDSDVQQTCVAALEDLPPRSLVLRIIGETEVTVRTHLRSYVEASTPVIAYVDRLFTSRHLSI